MDDLAEYQTLTPEFVVRSRLDFAQRAFMNAQELSRMLDQKASFLLSAVGLLTTALGIIAARALDAPSTSPVHDAVHLAGLIFFVLYVVIAVLVVWFSTQAFRASAHTLRPGTQAPGLLFPLLLLSRIKDGDSVDDRLYFESLNHVSVPDILRDYANQVVEISAIYERKQKAVNRSVALFQWLTMCWIVAMLLFVGVLILGGV
jgi:hypothetical protein